MTRYLFDLNNILFLSLSIIFIGCPDEGIQPTTNPLQLTIEDASCTEVFIKISLNTSEANRTVTLKRGDSSIAIITITGNDSLFVDEGLLPKKSYTYTLVKDSWNVSAQTTTQDTTSHEVQWQLPDTLGAQGLIRDVWVFSKTDAWAVGEIYLKDSTGKIDNANPYNAAHWNGSTWELKQIPFYTVCGQEHRTAYRSSSIFAFSKNDIWIAMEGDQVARIDSSGQIKITCMPVSFSIKKLWGANPNSMFAVGNAGTMIHYSNGSWTKMESHTTVDLQDIWGIDETHIWATGTNVGDGHSVVLQYDGKQWTVIYDSENQSIQNKFQFRSVWATTESRLYLDGGSDLHIMNTRTNIIKQINTGQTYASYCVRGTNQNDIFTSGQASEVTHFNGYTWNLYPEIHSIGNGFAWFYKTYPTTHFVLLGGVILTQLNGFPVVVRGYR